MSVGAKATIKAVVVTAAHANAALTLGRNTALQIAQVQTQITDAINALNVLVADMTRVNAADPNITTVNAIITSLS
jgi:hypothetical protein